MEHVTIYSTPTCPYCHAAKHWMKDNNVQFTEKDVSKDSAARDMMLEKSGQMGVPVIDVNGTILIGFNETALKNALKMGE